MRIAVLDDYHRVAHTFADWTSLNSEVAFFDRPIAAADLPRTLNEFDTLVLMRERTAFPRELLEQLPNLKLLVSTGMRNASVDIAYLNERGVTVCGTMIPGYGEPGWRGLPSTVEVAWALIFAVFKRVASEDAAMRRGVWQQGLPHNLGGLTLGLVGLGRLGSAMVAPAKVFGMDVIAWSENLTPERAQEAGAVYVSKSELMANADVLSIHLVLSRRTRGLIAAAQFAQMKPTATLINTSRGPIVDEPSLIAALRDGQIAAAGLDVYDREPLGADSELLALANTVLLPHLGYVSEHTLRAMYQQCVEDIAGYLAGEPIRVVS
jgi:phosphoglycerate dehydrogenase-like enzyme